MRAPYASDPAKSRGRLHAEPDSQLRTAFARDRDRLIHSTAFRRLRHKTQVFAAPDGDHFRVRLTHSLEVAQVARTIARALGLDEDLTEVLALGHDIGHPPFGHSGEDALTAAMEPFGGFDHNGHAIRLVTLLEVRTPAFAGLNLSWEVLEGLAKHNGPVLAPGWALATYDAVHDLELETHASLEAQVAALSDDIAYNAHDLDDGLRAGLLNIEEACERAPLIDALWRRVKAAWPDGTIEGRLIPALVRELIGEMVSGLMAGTAANLAEVEPASVEDVRGAGRTIACFTPAMQADIKPMRHYLRHAMYRHPKVARLRDPAEQVVGELFHHLLVNPQDLPPHWQAHVDQPEPWHGRGIGDYVAGMTDRYAIRMHERLTGNSPMPVDAYF